MMGVHQKQKLDFEWLRPELRPLMDAATDLYAFVKPLYYKRKARGVRDPRAGKRSNDVFFELQFGLVEMFCNPMSDALQASVVHHNVQKWTKIPNLSRWRAFCGHKVPAELVVKLHFAIGMVAKQARQGVFDSL